VSSRESVLQIKTSNNWQIIFSVVEKLAEGWYLKAMLTLTVEMSVIFMVCTRKTNFDLDDINKKSSIEIMSPVMKIRL
jgi:hypothetical protein